MTDSAPQTNTIWPIFVGAAALMAFGIALALTEDERQVEGTPVVQPALNPPTVHADGGPVELRYQPSPRRYRLVLSRTATLGGAEALLRLSTLVEERVDGEGVVRSYEGTEISAGAASPTLLAALDDVATQLDSTAYRLERDATGELTARDLVDSESAELASTSALVLDALSLLHPHVPRQAVAIGETWSWKIPISAKLAEARTEGVIDATARVTGRDLDGRPVLQTDFAWTWSGAVPTEDHGNIEVQGSGKGTGTTTWDPEIGAPHRGFVGLTTRRTIESETTESAIRMELSPVDVAAGQPRGE